MIHNKLTKKQADSSSMLQQQRSAPLGHFIVFISFLKLSLIKAYFAQSQDKTNKTHKQWNN